MISNEDPAFDCPLSIGELSTEDRLVDIFPSGGQRASGGGSSPIFEDLCLPSSGLENGTDNGTDWRDSLMNFQCPEAVSTSTASSLSLSALQEQEQASSVGEKRTIDAVLHSELPEGVTFPFSTNNWGKLEKKKAGEDSVGRPLSPKDAILGRDGSPVMMLPAASAEARIVTPPKKKAKAQDIAKDIGVVIADALINSSRGQDSEQELQQRLFESVMLFRDVLLDPAEQEANQEPSPQEDTAAEDIDTSDLNPLPAFRDVPYLHGSANFVHPALPMDPAGEYEIPLHPTMIPPGAVVTLKDVHGVERPYKVNYYCYWGTPEDANRLVNGFPEGSLTSSIDGPPPGADSASMPPPRPRFQHDTDHE